MRSSGITYFLANARCTGPVAGDEVVRRGNRLLVFLSRKLSYCSFSCFEGDDGLLNCINCNPFPRGTKNHPDEASEKFASLQTDSGFKLESGDRVKRCLSGGPAHGLLKPGRRCVETSGDVIENVFTAFRENLSSIIFNKLL